MSFIPSQMPRHRAPPSIQPLAEVGGPSSPGHPITIKSASIPIQDDPVPIPSRSSRVSRAHPARSIGPSQADVEGPCSPIHLRPAIKAQQLHAIEDIDLSFFSYSLIAVPD